MRQQLAFLVANVVVILHSYSFQIGRLPCISVSWCSYTNSVQSLSYQSSALYANPITQDGSNYGKFTNEEDAFLWFDEALFYVRAGSGGAGSSAVKFGANRQHKYPTGGNGGNGGNVILVADSNVNTLLGFRGSSHFRAENGVDGALEYCNGKAGKDTYISVPKGIIIKDNETDAVLGELNYIGDKLMVARGGNGGKGNAAFKSAVDASVARPPQGGEKKWLKIELKLVADVGLIGLPNAGKSTLLDAITNARPKIANYAFTTIIPNLGVCEIDKYQLLALTPNQQQLNKNIASENNDGGGSNNSNSRNNKYSDNNNKNSNMFDRMVIADIPGLIEGAHEGRGLGRGFLRHVERCKILIHLVDGTSNNPLQDYLTINNELQLFSSILANKPQIVVLNKIDIDDVSEKSAEITNQLKAHMSHKRLLIISAAARIGTEELIAKTYSFLEKIKKDEYESSLAIAAEKQRGNEMMYSNNIINNGNRRNNNPYKSSSSDVIVSDESNIDDLIDSD